MLNQGDLFRKLSLPQVRASFPELEEGLVPVDIVESDVIVLSQSCDLEQHKIVAIVVAQVFSLTEFEAVNPAYKTRGRWKEVSRGRVEALHLLPSPENPEDPRSAIVVDFRAIASLPVGYVETFADRVGERWRLLSPYLEDMSQAFGRFFMRVALPTDPIDP